MNLYENKPEKPGGLKKSNKPSNTSHYFYPPYSVHLFFKSFAILFLINTLTSHAAQSPPKTIIECNRMYSWTDNYEDYGGFGEDNISVECEENIHGFVENSTSLKYLKVIVTNQHGVQIEHTLQNPPSEIGEWQKEGFHNDQKQWIKQQLPKLNWTDTIEVAGMGINTDQEMARVTTNKDTQEK